MTMPSAPSTGSRQTRPDACLLAGAAFQRGGMERLTWEVHDALAGVLGSDRVVMASLVGPEDPDDPRAAGLAHVGSYPLTLGTKIRFSRWLIRRSLTWRSSTLLICMSVNQAQLAWGARAVGGSKYAVWAHGGEVWSKMESLPRLALRRSDLVLCSSEFTRKRVIRDHGVHPGKVSTLYPPVSETFLQRASRVTRAPGKAAPVILSIGRVSRGYEYKGYDQVIRALPHVAAKIPDVRYVIVGGGDALPDVARLSAGIGVAEKVELRGALSDHDLWRTLEEARVFVLPSRMEPTRSSLSGEGFGIVYAEAAAFGRPVVGSTMGGAAEAVVDGVTGRTVDPTDTEAIGEALLTYLDDRERADRDGAAGRLRVLRLFTPERFRANLLTILRQAGLVPENSSGSGEDEAEWLKDMPPES